MPMVEKQLIVHGDNRYMYRVREHPDFMDISKSVFGGVIIEFKDTDDIEYSDRLHIAPDCIDGLIEALKHFQQK